MPFQVFNEVNFVIATHQFDDASWSTRWDLMSQSLTVTRVDFIQITNRDSIDHTVNVVMHLSGIDYTAASVTVPAGSGTAGVAPVDLVAAQAPPLFQGFVSDNFDWYSVTISEAVSSGMTVEAIAGIGIC